MANNRKPDENVLFSWIFTVIMLGVAWPIGLFMLFRMLTNGSLSGAKKRRRAASFPYQAPAAGRSAPEAPAVRPIDPRWGQGLIIAGAIVTGLFGLLLGGTIMNTIPWWLSGYGVYAYEIQELITRSGLTAVGLVLLLTGLSRRRKAGRYQRYKALIGTRESLSLQSLAEAMPAPVKQVREDLQDMLQRGYLPSGYIDASGRLVLSESGIREEPKPEPPQPEPAEDDVLAQIRAVNDDIDDETMSRKIDRIGEITAKILDYQRQHPDSEPELRSFLNYYLPTTLKILRSYAQMENQGIEGENITAAKQRIEGMMDKVVEGFEKRLDKLFRSDAVDITSDVQVLEQMLQQDGLSADELKIEL